MGYRRHRGLRSVSAILLGLVVLSLAGCEPRRTDPIRSGWSRGLPLAAASLGDAPSLVVSPDARWIVWGDQVAGEPQLLMGRLSREASLEGVTPLPLSATYPHAPRLFLRDEELILFFLFRTGSGTDRLASQRLSGEGEPLGVPCPVSPEDHDVDSYAVVQTEGGYVAVWEEPSLGLHIQTITEDLELMGPPVLLAPRGGSPALAVDRSGDVHAAWLASVAPGVAELYYGRITLASPSVPEPRYLGKVTGGLGALFLGPELALDEQWAYAALSVDYRGGTKAGTVETQVFAVPQDASEQVHTISLYVPPLLPETVTDLGNGLLVDPVPEAPRPGVNVRVLSGYPVEQDFALITVAAKLSSLRKEEFQPAVVSFQGGREVGWCPVAVTQGSPAAAELVRSPAGWHVVWLDMHASGEYSVLYATTSSAERAILDRFSASDLAHIFFTVLSGIVGGLASIPLFLLAAVPGLLVIAGHYILGGEGDLRLWRSRILLAVGLVPYAALKLLFISGLVVEFPFAGWMAPSVARALSIALPVAFLGTGLLAVGVYWRRSDEPGLLPAYVLFIVVDIVLSLFLVGPSLAGA